MQQRHRRTHARTQNTRKTGPLSRSAEIQAWREAIDVIFPRAR